MIETISIDILTKNMKIDEILRKEFNLSSVWKFVSKFIFYSLLSFYPMNVNSIETSFSSLLKISMFIRMNFTFCSALSYAERLVYDKKI